MKVTPVADKQPRGQDGDFRQRAGKPTVKETESVKENLLTVELERKREREVTLFQIIFKNLINYEATWLCPG